MKEIDSMYKIPFPAETPAENMKFACSLPFGTFTFQLKWFNGRWNCWVTLPDGEIRQAGVNPNIYCWTGFNDYGLLFVTALQEISQSQIFDGELYLIKWK